MRLVVSVWTLWLVVCFASAVAQVSQADQKVNMVSGTDWTTGGLFLQSQNEPSIAVSTRNNFFLLAGNNDYGTVDLRVFWGFQKTAMAGSVCSSPSTAAWPGAAGCCPAFLSIHRRWARLRRCCSGKEALVESRESSPISGSRWLL